MGRPDPQIRDAMLAHLRRNHPSMCRHWFDDIEPLDMTSGTLNLGGNFTVDGLGINATPPRFTRSGGTVNLTGTLNNTGAELVLAGATSSWQLAGGTILGGTVTTTGGAKLLGVYPGQFVAPSKLNGVTLNGDLEVVSTPSVSTSVTVLNGLVLNGRVPPAVEQKNIL